jgi:hypothetical protein
MFLIYPVISDSVFNSDLWTTYAYKLHLCIAYCRISHPTGILTLTCVYISVTVTSVRLGTKAARALSVMLCLGHVRECSVP